MFDQRAILHVDMDAFFAAVEQRDNPALRGKPVIVGGSPRSRGVVSTCSYEARRYGVRSAMSCSEAYARCPQAVFVRPDFRRYREASRLIFAIFRDQTEIVEGVSIDEAYLDVTGQDPLVVAREIKRRVREEVGLTCSVGISYNKFLAKLASDMEKPDGLTVIHRERAEAILPGLSVRKILGVGKRSEEALNRIGIFTIADLRRTDPELLSRLFGKRGEELYQLAYGRDDRPVGEGHDAASKSVSEETTFDRDTDDLSELSEMLRQFAEELCAGLQARGRRVKTITVKLRYEDFTNLSRGMTLPDYVNDPTVVHETADCLLRKVPLENHKVRLIGLQLSNFLMPDEPYQLQFDFWREIKVGPKEK
ncbi:MAG: DNA polymerase IV [Bacillota bacterium]